MTGHQCEIILEDAAFEHVDSPWLKPFQLNILNRGPRLPVAADVLWRQFNVVFPKEGRYVFGEYVDGIRLGGAGVWVLQLVGNMYKREKRLDGLRQTRAGHSYREVSKVLRDAGLEDCGDRGSHRVFRHRSGRKVTIEDPGGNRPSIG